MGNIILSTSRNITVVNSALHGICCQGGIFRKFSKSLHNELNRHRVTSSKKDQIVHKTEVDNSHLFKFGMEVKIGIAMKILEDSIQIIHDQHKEHGRKRVSLPKAPFRDQNINVLAIDIISIRNSSYGKHNQANKFVRKIHLMENSFNCTPLNRVIRFLEIDLNHNSWRTIFPTVPLDQLIG